LDVEDVADWLERTRAEVGMKISALSEGSGVARTTIYRILDKEGVVDEATVLALAKAMHVQPPLLRQVVVVGDPPTPPTALSLVRHAKASIERAERLLSGPDGRAAVETFRPPPKKGKRKPGKTA